MCGFAQQRACKFTCQNEACTPKSSSVRTAHGGLTNRQSTPLHKEKPHKNSTPSKRYSEIVALCFIRACFESEYRLRGSTTKILLNGKGFSKKEKPCKIARIFVGFDTHSVWLFFEKTAKSTPLGKQKKHILRYTLCCSGGFV